MNWTYICLFVTLLLGAVHSRFSIEPMTPDPFPLIDFGKDSAGNQVYISYQVYVDRICDHLIWIIWTGLLAYHVPKYLRFGAIVFCSFQLFDLVDFLLSYNSIWTQISGISISMNVLKATIFGIIILKSWIKSIGNQYSGF